MHGRLWTRLSLRLVLMALNFDREEIRENVAI